MKVAMASVASEASTESETNWSLSYPIVFLQILAESAWESMELLAMLVSPRCRSGQRTQLRNMSWNMVRVQQQGSKVWQA